jgi:mannose-6-phosphate isomerase-like protein (cupin superfamily)
METAPIQTQREVITDRPGRRITLLLDTPDLTVTESLYGPGERGPEPHVHHEHVDSFLVVEGALTFGFRDGTLEASAGTFLSVPRDVAHSFWNESPETTRFLNYHSPSCGFGDYLRGRNPGFDQHDPPQDGGLDPAAVVVVALPG